MKTAADRMKYFVSNSITFTKLLHRYPNKQNAIDIGSKSILQGNSIGFIMQIPEPSKIIEMSHFNLMDMASLVINNVTQEATYRCGKYHNGGHAIVLPVP
jgi:hypothetical protein